MSPDLTDVQSSPGLRHIQSSLEARMETADLVPLIENLDDNIDDLEEALSTILSSTLSDTAANLPLLEKAHLYVLVTYAIESILFCMRLTLD